MPLIDDLHGIPAEKAGNEADNAMERDFLAMPDLPWTPILATFFAVVLAAGVAHAILLATHEKNKLISQTLARNEREAGFVAAAVSAPVKLSGHDMTLIPAGPFLMGRSEKDETVNSDATPEHTVNLPAFYIDAYEVTNGQYQEFIKAAHYIPPPHWKGVAAPPALANIPVTYVNWEQAKAYATWRGNRLCTEEEWEKAARGTDGRIYPYGNDYDPSRANIDYLVEGLTPVGSYPQGASPYGVMDLMGNVYEWTSTRYEPYPGNRDDPAKYAAFKTDRSGNVTIDTDRKSFYVVTRGGCWKCDPFSSQVTTRNPTRPGYAADFFGFRTCKDAGAVATK